MKDTYGIKKFMINKEKIFTIIIYVGLYFTYIIMIYNINILKIYPIKANYPINNILWINFNINITYITYIKIYIIFKLMNILTLKKAVKFYLIIKCSKKKKFPW